jgi:hypothetical protein
VANCDASAFRPPREYAIKAMTLTTPTITDLLCAEAGRGDATGPMIDALERRGIYPASVLLPSGGSVASGTPRAPPTGWSTGPGEEWVGAGRSGQPPKSCAQ